MRKRFWVLGLLVMALLVIVDMPPAAPVAETAADTGDAAAPSGDDKSGGTVTWVDLQSPRDTLDHGIKSNHTQSACWRAMCWKR